MSNKLKTIIAVVVIVVIGALTGVGLNISINNQKEAAEANVEVTVPEAEIEYADEQIPAVITEETGQGAVEQEVTEIGGEVIPTVEAVDSNGPVTEVENTECPEGEECGRGAAFNVDITTPATFQNTTFNRCIDVDGYYGAQCWDLGAAFWLTYTGRTLTTCGTGAAKGAIADGCWQQNNAGGEFTMIWNPAELQAGDWVFFNTGTWGHVGMAMGSYNNGYITLLGQNQGGGYCAGGGSSTNIINISLRDFAGAFRPNIYIPPEPAPEPEPEPVNTCQVREVVKGDTLGKIMQECRGEVEWGEPMNEYARHWYSTKYMVYPTVFDGWASTGGYGLFAGDVIEFRSE